MKKIITTALVLSGVIAYAQNNEDYTGRVGINTDKPKATLDISAKTADGTRPEGMLIPRITYAKMEEMKSTLTEEQDGLMVFVSDAIDYNTLESKDSYYNLLYSSPYYVFNAGLGDFIPFTPTGLTAVKANNFGERGINSYFYPSYDLSINSTHKKQSPNSYKIGPGSVNLSVIEMDNGEIGPFAFSVSGGQATGENSVAMQKAEATGKNSFAVGYAKASGSGSFAIGFGAQAIGNSSIAIGYTSRAEGEYSMALGGYLLSNAVGPKTVSIGGTANGHSSMSFLQGVTNGVLSIAMGTSVETYNANEIALGHNNFSTDGNIVDDSYEINDKQLFSIGSGNKLNGHSKHNAIVVLRNSKTGIGLDTDTTTPANSKPTEMLDVNGNIRVRGNTEETVAAGSPCTNPGTISFYQDNFYGCKSTGWVKLNN